MSPKVVSLVTQAAFAALALTFIAVAALALLTDDVRAYPIWLAGPVGLLVAAALFAVGWVAPRRSSAIVWDEATQDAWLRAQATGYWVGILAFVAFGNMVAAGWVDLGTAFLVSAMLTAAAPFVRFLAGAWLVRP
ncbi:hypothetical protein DXV76_04245 [Rhodobacteraceae bacterium CCMM004]|nr:hypothetical protein DXV76_04245 [Rhodobacteraceae bacterium CCMM004]